MSACCSWIEEIREHAVSKSWKNIIDLGQYIPIEEKSKYLWAWPTEHNINFLQDILNGLNIQGILSIGCGSGLLEWILQESTGTKVSGLELDRSWWSSNYCPKSFIELNFTEDAITPDFLQKCAKRTDWSFALLFCYFNCRKSFLEYLNAFRGNCLIIIGPGEGRGTHTDPKPFEPGFERDTWNLYNYCEIGTTKDFIAIYTKNNICC